jgi:hypothetical protein
VHVEKLRTGRDSRMAQPSEIENQTSKREEIENGKNHQRRQQAC